MTRAVGRGACDPCCTDWKQKIRELWENYQEVVKGIKAGSDTVYPDGNGIADIDGAIENEVARQISDESLVTSKDLQTAIADMATIQDLDSGLSTLQSTKQDKLVNQVNIKSINGVSLLGSGNMQVSADSVAWDNVTDKPEFAEVATSGSYEDLTDKPTIPAAQVNADWDAASGVAQILNKPNLATVATTGDYDDLSDKPTIPSGADLVPSTSGVTDGYVLTNDNGTPAWRPAGGGSGATIKTYSNFGDFMVDALDIINNVKPGVIFYKNNLWSLWIAPNNSTSGFIWISQAISSRVHTGRSSVVSTTSTATTLSVSTSGFAPNTSAGTISAYTSTETVNINDLIIVM